MADKINFNFVEKEGKFFSPIVSEVPDSYRLATQVEISDSTTTKYSGDDGNMYVGVGTTEKSGIKGVFARVRLALPIEVSGSRHELFAINSETFRSSN